MSRKRGNELSLSEKLSSLIHTKPSIVESDDDDLTTVDKIALNGDDSEYSAEELDTPKFKRINNNLLEEDDVKYSGRGISRKDLNDSEGSEGSEEDTAELKISEEEEDESGEDFASEESDVEDEEVSRSEEESPNDKIRLGGTKDDENVFNQQIFSKASSDIEKGRAIKNQLHMWDFLLECRIKLQKNLVASNQLPKHDNYSKFQEKGGAEFLDAVHQSKTSVKHLLRSLLTLQHNLLKSNEDYLSTQNTQKGNISKTEDNEEIESSEGDDENFEEINENSASIKKLKKLSDFAEEIDNIHNSIKNYRNDTIQKWYDKTRIGYISNKNFSAFEQSTLKQIENILLDKQRLIKRTRTKRSSYHILGQEDTEPPGGKKLAKSAEVQTNTFETKSNGILEKEIFDDDDFYHQLLSELVKRKANDVIDPVQLGRQWMQLQKIRSKMKKSVDTKASKGRKVRFVVHQKLVNFMMPVNNIVYNEDSRVELLNSLFGKNK